MSFYCTVAGPVVETSAGKLRGFTLDGVQTFLGIKYADAKRFHMPEPVLPQSVFEKSFLPSARPTLRYICLKFGQRSTTTPPSFEENLPPSGTHT